MSSKYSYVWWQNVEITKNYFYPILRSQFIKDDNFILLWSFFFSWIVMRCLWLQSTTKSVKLFKLCLCSHIFEASFNHNGTEAHLNFKFLFFCYDIECRKISVCVVRVLTSEWNFKILRDLRWNCGKQCYEFFLKYVISDVYYVNFSLCKTMLSQDWQDWLLDATFSLELFVLWKSD